MASNGVSSNGVGAQQPGKANLYVHEAVKDAKTAHELGQYLVNYAHNVACIGLGNGEKEKFQHDIAVTPPLALLPSAFPKELYERALSVQQTLNELYYQISLDHDFIMETYKDVVKGDPFMAECAKIMDMVHKEGIHNKASLIVQRADYMSHRDPEDGHLELQQVEVNVGQVGGPGATTAVSKVHKRMVEKAESLNGAPLSVLENAKLPENKTRQNIAKALYAAWKYFGDPKAVVVFCNQPDLFPVCHYEQLQFVQFELEKLARKDGKYLNVLRMNLRECGEKFVLNEKDFSLSVEGKPVAVVHMAYGYMAEHYPTQVEWAGRIKAERSTAIVSPNIRNQIGGSKKTQQVLALPGMIERFLPNQPERVAELRRVFTEIWGLEADDEPTKKIIKAAVADPKNYVLKAQMGCGKGNFFDDEMAKMLQTMSLDERGAYILQKKIWPITTENYFKRPFVDEPAKMERVVSEMGIYGCLLGVEAGPQRGKVVHNSVDGFLVRSKSAASNQGGVSEGSGVIDSLMLFPSSEFH